MSDDIIAARDRSVVYRRGDAVHKVYRRADPRNDVERGAYMHLARFDAPVPCLLDATAEELVLEAITSTGDFEHALRTGDALSAARAMGCAYAELHAVPPAGPATRDPLDVAPLGAWCDAIDVPPPDLRRARAAMEQPGAELAFSHGDPAPSNALLRPDGDVVLVDFEYAGARHRGYDLAGWHVLCPLAPDLLSALHEGYGREIDHFAEVVVWRAVQVVGMNRIELLDADREFAPGWSARASLLTALRRGGEHEPGLLPLHDALAVRWPDAAGRIPQWT
jgi:hypothetical protein